MSCDVGEVKERLENDQSSHTHSRAQSPTFPSLDLRHSSFSNPSVASPPSQLILQPICCFILQPFRNFTYVTAHYPTLPSLYLRHSSFCNPSVTLPTSQLMLKPFHRFTYVIAHSATLPSLYLRHSSFSNPSVNLPMSRSFSNASVNLSMSQFILQPFFRFSLVTSSSFNSPGEPPMLNQVQFAATEYDSMY